MTLHHVLLPFFGAIVIVLGLQCGSDDRRTGIETLDPIIDAVEAGDTGFLIPLVQTQTLRCGETGADPRCPPASEATIEMLETHECEQKWLPAADIEPFLHGIASMEPRLYAVFEETPDYFLSGAYVLVFEGDDPRDEGGDTPRGIALAVTGGRITAIALGCSVGEPIHFLLPHTPVRYLVEP